jgi:hypothetical protein
MDSGGIGVGLGGGSGSGIQGIYRVVAASPAAGDGGRTMPGVKLEAWLEAGRRGEVLEVKLRSHVGQALEDLREGEDPAIFTETEWPDGGITLTVRAALRSGLATVTVKARLDKQFLGVIRSREIETDVIAWPEITQLRLVDKGDEDASESTVFSWSGGSLSADRHAREELVALFLECARRSRGS